MATRAVVNVRQSTLDSSPVVKIYTQSDGSPSGFGDAIVKEIRESKVIHGIRMGQESPTFFSGMGCLAAYLVWRLKEAVGKRPLVHSAIGTIYLLPLGEGKGKKEYEYDIYLEESLIPLGESAILRFRCKKLDEDGKVIYEGLLSHFNGVEVEGESEEDDGE